MRGTFVSLSHREREGAAKRREGEGRAVYLPSPRAAAQLAPLPQGEGRKITILPAHLTHIGPIATRMRAADRIEWTALVDGRAEAMFGLVVTSALGGEGRPWMLGSDAIYAHPRAMLRRGPRFLAAMFHAAPRLSNLVAADNVRAIRLLRRWGFTLDKETMMIGNIAFRLFHAERR